MSNFKKTKTILENINEQDDKIEQCIDIVNGIATEQEVIQQMSINEEIRQQNELIRQQDELLRQEQYTNNENRFNSIDNQLIFMKIKKANKDIVRLKSENIDLDDMTARTLEAIQGGEGANFTLSSLPRDGSVSYEKTTFFNVEKSINVFDKNSVTDMGYVIGTNGKLTADSNGCISDFISVEEGDTINIYNNWVGAFYDANKNYVINKPYGSKTFTVPPNCFFYRQSINIAILNRMMITINNDLPLTYVPYSTIITPTDEFKNILFNNDFIEMIKMIIDQHLSTK